VRSLHLNLIGSTKRRVPGHSQVGKGSVSGGQATPARTVILVPRSTHKVTLKGLMINPVDTRKEIDLLPLAHNSIGST
jgi:hypothetical protein